MNCPLQIKPYLYERDGVAPVKDNEKDSPNSFHGPVPYIDKNRAELVQVIENDNPNNFNQIRAFHEYEMMEAERRRLVNNMLNSLRTVTDFLKYRAIKFSQ